MEQLNKTIIILAQGLVSALLTGSLVGALLGSAYSVFKWVAE